MNDCKHEHLVYIEDASTAYTSLDYDRDTGRLVVDFDEGGELVEVTDARLWCSDCGKPLPFEEA